MSEFIWTGEEEIHYRDGKIKKVTDLTEEEVKEILDSIASTPARSIRLQKLKIFNKLREQIKPANSE
jgi:hypothetical protein